MPAADGRRDDVRNDPVAAETVREHDDAQPLARIPQDVAVEPAAVVAPVPDGGPGLGLLQSPAQAPCDLAREPSRRLAGGAVGASLVHRDLRPEHLGERLLLQAGTVERGDQETRIVEGRGVQRGRRERLRRPGEPTGRAAGIMPRGLSALVTIFPGEAARRHPERVEDQPLHHAIERLSGRPLDGLLQIHESLARIAEPLPRRENDLQVPPLPPVGEARGVREDMPRSDRAEPGVFGVLAGKVLHDRRVEVR